MTQNSWLHKDALQDFTNGQSIRVKPLYMPSGAIARPADLVLHGMQINGVLVGVIRMRPFFPSAACFFPAHHSEPVTLRCLPGGTRTTPAFWQGAAAVRARAVCVKVARGPGPTRPCQRYRYVQAHWRHRQARHDGLADRRQEDPTDRRRHDHCRACGGSKERCHCLSRPRDPMLIV
jgi:hypothetical protein